MALAARASGAIAGYPAGVGITCHQAVWFWAAEEATAQGLVPARTLLARMGNIANMPGTAQGAMLRLPRASAFDFNHNPAMPPQGTVLLWLVRGFGTAMLQGATTAIFAMLAKTYVDRGRPLATKPGHALQLRCPFHGFTWQLNGQLKEIPCRWDFPQVNDEECGHRRTLPEYQQQQARRARQQEHGQEGEPE